MHMTLGRGSPGISMTLGRGSHPLTGVSGGKHPPRPWSPTSDGESQTLGYAPLEYQTKPWPKEALPDGWCPFSCGAHVLFNIVANGIAECFAKSRLLDGNRQIENSLPRSGIAVFVHTREMAARCRNLGGMDWCVLDISFSRRTGIWGSTLAWPACVPAWALTGGRTGGWTRLAYLLRVSCT